MMLDAAGLSVNGARGSRILCDVSLRIASGDRLAVVGPNGAGKSTLLRALAGIELPVAGDVSIDGHSLRSVARRDAARRIALCAEAVRPAFPFTALELVLLGRMPHLGAMGLNGADDEERARSALDRLGVGALAERTLATLSTGERQRVAIARALVQEPEFLLLDEPLSAQDFDGAARILAELDARWRTGTAVVAVLHDLDLALRAFERVVVLHRGRVAWDGPGEALLRSDVPLEVWGGALEVRALADDGQTVRVRLPGGESLPATRSDEGALST